MKKKYDTNTSLAKIKILIDKHYEGIGREMVEDINIEQKELIEALDEILNSTNLSSRHLIIERLEIDSEVKDELKGLWKA